MAKVVYLSKELMDELNKFKERHIPAIPFEPVKGELYPDKPLNNASVSTLTDIDIRSLLVAGKGKIYSQYVCIAGKRDSNAQLIRYNKRVIDLEETKGYTPIRKIIEIEKIIKRPIFSPAPNAIDLTEYFLKNSNLAKKVHYTSGCYYCKKPITNNTNLCEDCNRYYLCSNCYRCLCDRSSSLVK